jgi:outer membrane usher protein
VKHVHSLRKVHSRWAGFVLFAWLATSHAETNAPRVKTSTDRVTPLEVIVNGTRSGTWLMVEHDNALYAPRAAFEDWRIALKATAPHINFRGEEYWALASVAGYRSTLNIADQSLDVLFSPDAFARTQLGSPVSKVPAIGATLTSVFLNYDLTYQRTESSARNTLQNLGMLGEIGISSGLGVLTSSALGRNLTNNTAQGNPERRLVRLETTFTKDFADTNTSLLVGDTTTRASMTGASVYFGGIRFGSNFALAPGFISHPVPLLSGVSAVPSTVSLYVDDVLRQTSNVPTGPFTIDNSPVLTGGGEARLVVRDLLGRETVITRSFLASNKLLASHLDDWSVEAGRLRLNLGTDSASYGDGFVRGVWRHGYNEELTLEGVAEATSTQRGLGLGLVSILARQWLGSAALAASRHVDLGTGGQWLLGAERQGLRSSFFFQAQGATNKFRDLGQAKDFAPVKLQLVASATYASDRSGAFGVGLIVSRAFDDLRINTLTLNYSIPVGNRGALSLSASRSQGDINGSSLGFSLVLPFDQGRMISAAATHSANQKAFHVTAIQNPTQENGLGWRLLAGQEQDRGHAEGSLNYLGRYGNLNADLSATPEQRALRLSGNGALVLVDGHLFASQRQNGSFALAEVTGYGDVGIGLGNHVLTHTNASGVALIPQLVPYQSNSVRLDPADLPVSAEIGSIEQIAVPARRSVVKVIFPVRRGRSALLKIQLDDGGAAPAGAIVQIEGDPQEFYTARRGEAFVTGLQSTNRVRLTWKGKQCTFEVVLPPESSTEIARVGSLPCRGMTR